MHLKGVYLKGPYYENVTFCAFIRHLACLPTLKCWKKDNPVSLLWCLSIGKDVLRRPLQISPPL